MDIEGAEYRALHSMPDALLKRFRIMVFEFHALSSIFTRAGMGDISSAFRKILTTHNIVHIHPNNAAQPDRVGDISIPSVMEFTLYRKDRATFTQAATRYPCDLDVDNMPALPRVVLPEVWHY